MKRKIWIFAALVAFAMQFTSCVVEERDGHRRHRWHHRHHHDETDIIVR